MSRDGSGNYSLPEAAYTSGTTISSTSVNSNLSDIASALTASLAKDGQTTPTANLPMGSNKLTGLANGTARTDAAAAGQVQDLLVNWVAAGGSADAITAAYSPAYSALTDGMICFVRFASDNATTTPTFSPSSLTARTIVKWGGDALAAGDIQQNAEGILRYNSANTRWELLNPRDSTTVTTTRGDLIVRGASADGRLAVGAANRVLKSDGTDPAWGQVTGPMIAMGSDAQGDILYHNGASYVRLGAGTSGQFLQTQGAGANPTWAAAGAIVQTVEATPYTSNTDITTVIPDDDTIPQNTEGVQILTLSITPTSASNKIRLKFCGFVGASSGGTAANAAISALFVNSTASAIYAHETSTNWGGNPRVSAICWEFTHSPATTSATTYNVRVGPDANTIRMNGTSSARRFGGVAQCTLIAEEVT